MLLQPSKTYLCHLREYFLFRNSINYTDLPLTYDVWQWELSDLYQTLVVCRTVCDSSESEDSMVTVKQHQLFTITVTYGLFFRLLLHMDEQNAMLRSRNGGGGGAFTNFSVFLMHSSTHFFAFDPWNPSFLGALRLIWDLSVEWFIIGFQNYLGKLHDRTPFALIRILFVRITRLKILKQLFKKTSDIYSRYAQPRSWLVA